MARLITSDSQLRAHVPNIIPAVKGEPSLYDKLSQFIDMAEDWVIRTFTGRKLFDEICDCQGHSDVRLKIERLVATETMIEAIPSLDVVLTPNGFGVVSTQNLTPASKQRVDRLIESMIRVRDNCIDALLRELPAENEWIESYQGQYFAGTLFQNLDIVDVIGEEYISKWDKWLELHPIIAGMETRIAACWISHELMEHLRKGKMTGSLSMKEKYVWGTVANHIIMKLKTGIDDRWQRSRLSRTLRIKKERR